MKIDAHTCPKECLEHTTFYLNGRVVEDVIMADEEGGFVIVFLRDKDGNPMKDERYYTRNGLNPPVMQGRFGKVKIVFDPGFEPEGGLMIDNELVSLSRLKERIDSGEHPPIGQKERKL
jgi:hypothetical protein